MTEPASPTRVLVLADFNAANFAAYLGQDLRRPQISATVDVFSAPLDGGRSIEAGSPYDVVVVWTRPESVSGAFADLLNGHKADLAGAIADVDAFATQIGSWAERVGRVIVMSWAVPRLMWAFGSLAWREGLGLSNVLSRMTIRLAEAVEKMPGVVMMDTTGWIDARRAPEEAKLWYAAKIPFGNEVFQRAARQVKSTLRASSEGPRKLVIVDLDNTIWGGVVGDVGWEALRLGGHDAVGEAFVDFQRALLALSRRGILLGVVSKNEERVAMDAMTKHPEMLIRPEAVAGWRINWDDKAANVAALCRQLNLGLEAVVFIDDSPAERARVREALPAVLVPEWPASPMLFVDALIGLDCFDMVDVTAEDWARSGFYAAELTRVGERGPEESLGEWLRRLELSVEVEEFNDRNAPRVVQLLNKTNQMNLTTRRVDLLELVQWLRTGTRRLWTFRVRDRFGDAGLTGVASLEIEGRYAHLVDFVLSCRVFGRKVEHSMLHVISQSARDGGATELVADFKPTAKNVPCLRFLEASGLRREGEARFLWDLSTEFPPPPDVDLRRPVGVTT